RMAILSGDRITMDDLPEEGVLSEGRRGSTPPSDLPPTLDESGGRLTLREYRSRAEKEYILQTLDEVGWNISRAATILGVERTNLHKKMRTYGIRRAEG
ncbi:MAG: sigma-54-dependent Fis family transcriptional regulator, partial [Myxococcales bacterium]|nr:sigma-54-dependent Fis family transcriptional regulator [Myxococcales bacterium]